MKYFVTGGDGLLGSNLVRDLLDHGHTVRVLIFPGSKSAALDGLAVESVEGDLLDDAFSLKDALKGCDGVFHCAAITDLWADPDIVWKVNLEGTRRILDACLDAAVKRLVFVGSASSFEPGSVEKPGDETRPFPEAYRGVAYMESKHQAADLVREYVRERNLDAVIVAPTFLLGPHDSRPSGGELVLQFIKRPMRFTASGGRSFAYAPDVAKATFSAMENGRTGQTYILGGQNLDYLDFFSRLAKATGLEAPTRVLPGPAILLAGALASAFGTLTGSKPKLNKTVARFALLGAYYSSDKAIEELRMPQTAIETSIEESIRALNQYGHLNAGDGYFRGKVALITGGSRGVGFAIARALALKGAKVVLTARGDARLQKAKETIESLGGDVAVLAGDVGKPADAEAIVQTALERFGRIDILVNNAGVSMRGRFEELTPEVCEQVVSTNLLGCMHMTHAALERLIASKGQIVFVSSIAGLFGVPGASIYCATKKALAGLTESLRLELIPKGLHVGIIYLGFTEHDPEKRIIAADGSLVPPDRPAHHTQANAAALIVKMLEKRKRQLVMTPAGAFGGLVYRLSPRFLERLILWAQASQWGVFKRFS